MKFDRPDQVGPTLEEFTRLLMESYPTPNAIFVPPWALALIEEQLGASRQVLYRHALTRWAQVNG